MPNCPTCNRPTEPWATHCAACGQALVAAQPPTVASPPPPAIPASSGRGLGVLIGAVGSALVFGLLAAALVMTGLISVGRAETRLEGPGFGSAEAALTSYLDAAQAGDVDQMMRSFAIETYVAHYDLKAMIERLETYVPSLPLSLPSGKVNDQLLNGRRFGDIAMQINNQYVTLSGPSWDPTRIWPLNSGVTVDEIYTTLQDTLDGSGLTGITSWRFVTLAEVDPSRAEDVESDDYRVFADQQRRILRADAVESLIVELTNGTGRFYLTAEAARYGSTWWLTSLQGSLGSLLGIPYTSGGVLPA